MSRISAAAGVLRRPASRKDRLLRTGILLGSVLIIAAVAWILLFSPWLVLRTVTVHGTALVRWEDVEAAAQPALGTPLARVSERAVAERVASLPAVKQVTVSRQWPATLDIQVDERRPVLVIGDGANSVLVDAAGASFPGVAPEGVVKARGPLSDSRLLAGVATLVEAFPEELQSAAVLVEFTSADSITVRLTEDRDVFFGSADQAALKAEVALALLRGTTAEHIDVSAPTRPSTR
jgi:cell division protein FtsQ